MATSPELSVSGSGASIRERLLSRAYRLDSIGARWRIIGLPLVCWVPLVVLAAAGGLAAARENVSVPLLLDISVGVRFLVALPLLVAAEEFNRTTVFELCEHFSQYGIVASRHQSRFEQLVAQFVRLRQSRIAHLILALVVILGTIFFRIEFAGDFATWQFVNKPGGTGRSLAGWWYLFVSIPIFQFQLAMTVWRYAVWCRFLLRMSQLDLVLVPTHPDRSAGLTVIGHAHAYFGVVLFSLSSLISANIGMQLLRGSRTLVAFGIEAGTFLVLALAIAFVPLLVFTPKLIRVRRRGLIEYGALAAEYTREFDRKWVHRSVPPSEPLVGSADIQSLADLANSYEIVQGMHVVPFEVPWTLIAMALCVIVPFLPLAFAVASPADVIKGLIEVLL